jgi:hypothetical protein
MNVALAILLLSTIWVGALGPVYNKALRLHALGAERRAEQLAGYVHAGARDTGVDEGLLTVLLYLESGFRAEAVNARVGAFGLGALHPRSRWARGLHEGCARSPSTCEQLSVVWSARALARGIRDCGGEVEGVGWYRSGRCIAGPRSRLAMRLRDRVFRRITGETDVPCRSSRSRHASTSRSG